MLLIFVRNPRQKLELTDMRDAECVQEIANFSQVLFPPISFRVTKNSLYIWTSHTLFIYLLYILTSHLLSRSESQKNPIFKYLDITHTLSKKNSLFLSHINIFIFTPFSFRGTKKQPILTSHIFSLCFSHFLSYINFPSLLVQLYKSQPIYGGRIFSSSFTYSYITCIKILTFPSIWFRVKEDGPVSLVYKRTASRLYIPFQNKIS